MKRLQIAPMIMIGLITILTYACNKEGELIESQPPHLEELKNQFESGIDGVWLENGILSFQDQETVEQVYTLLEEAIEEQNEIDPEEEQFESEECLPDYPILDEFEASFGFHSIRKKSEEDECELLNQGVNPEDVFDPILIDDVLLTLLNHNYQIRIGNTIHMLLNEEVAVEIPNLNYEILDLLENGVNPLELGDEVSLNTVSGKWSCLADFVAHITPGNSTVNFNFTGYYSGSSVDITWTFGDGTIGSGSNTNHAYSSAGTYNVCVIVEDYDALCINTYCQEVQIGPSCISNFDYTQGMNGEVNFSNLSNAGTGGVITSYLWSFGDGTTSNQPNPVHNYACNTSVNVCLTITTNENCVDTYCKKVNVGTQDCCGSKGSVKGFAYYSNGNKRFKYKQQQTHWLFLKRVRAKMTNYKKKFSGKWKKKKAFLKIDLDGRVYKKDANGCLCNDPKSINKSKSAFSSTLNISHKTGPKFQTRKSDPWSAHYFAAGQQILQQYTPVICD